MGYMLYRPIGQELYDFRLESYACVVCVYAAHVAPPDWAGALPLPHGIVRVHSCIIYTYTIWATKAGYGAKYGVACTSSLVRLVHSIL